MLRVLSAKSPGIFGAKWWVRRVAVALNTEGLFDFDQRMKNSTDL